MNSHLTAGEFQTMTGLSAKALRLYAERGIVIPAFVDPQSAYRLYASSQLQHGSLVDLLRKAQVSLKELPTTMDFDFDARRETVALNRVFEDFYLDVAEKVATFSPDDFLAHRSPAPAVEWVGIVVDLGIPDATDEKLAAFSGWAADLPAIERSFTDALDHLGIATSATTWSAVPESAHNGSQELVLARSVLELPSSASLDLLGHRVQDQSHRSISVVSGTLPPRLEITFSAESDSPLSPVEEAAQGHLQLLAFERYIEVRGLTALRRTARQVSHAGALLPAAVEGTVADGPISVFDVQLPSGERAENVPEPLPR
jgi:DNA-binding transcriptional MerR regulator